jgi:hypothetical protein
MSSSVQNCADLKLYAKDKMIISSHLEMNVQWSSVGMESKVVIFRA